MAALSVFFLKQEDIIFILLQFDVYKEFIINVILSSKVLIMERVELWCLMPLSIIFNNGFRLFKVLYSKKDMKLVFSRFISRGEILCYSR